MGQRCWVVVEGTPKTDGIEDEILFYSKGDWARFVGAGFKRSGDVFGQIRRQRSIRRPRGAAGGGFLWVIPKHLLFCNQVHWWASLSHSQPSPRCKVLCWLIARTREHGVRLNIECCLLLARRQKSEDHRIFV